MIKSEPASFGSADVQNTISCVDCKLSWRLEKELPIQSLTSCFPGPSLLGDIKDDDKIKLSVFVLASSNRNPPCIAALHLESLNSPWKIGHLKTCETDYVADRNTLFNTEYVVCKILNQQELPNIKREPCQDEKCMVESTQRASTKPLTANKRTQTIVRTSMQTNAQHLSTSQVKLEPNLNIIAESNNEGQSDVACETRDADINYSLNETQSYQIDEDLSIEVKDEPIGDIKKEEIHDLNKLTSINPQNKNNTTSNICLGEVITKPIQPTTSLTKEHKRDNSIIRKNNYLPAIKDKSTGNISNQTNFTELTINNVNENNLFLNKDKVMNIKEEPVDIIDAQSQPSGVDTSNIISYDIKEEMLEEYRVEQQEDHANQTTFKIDKNKIFKGKAGNIHENKSTVLQKEKSKLQIDVKDEPIGNTDCDNNSITKSSHVNLEKACNDNSILMIDTKELQDILKCVQDIGNDSETEPKIVQNATISEVKVKNIDNLIKKTVNIEEKHIHNEKINQKKNLCSKSEELKNKSASKVFYRDDSSDNNSSSTILPKNTEISVVVANITEKILGDINVMKSTSLNSTVKKQNTNNSSENCKDSVTTLKSTCETSKIIKKELLSKNDQNLATNEDLTKLVLTRNKNHNDWNVLVTLDNERRKSTEEFDKHAKSDLGNSKECISNVSNKNNSVSLTKMGSNFENSVGIQNLDSGKQTSSIIENSNSHLTKLSMHESSIGNECLKNNNDGHKIDESELVNKVNELEYKVQNLLKKVEKGDIKNVIIKESDAIETDIQKHKKTTNNFQNENCVTKDRQRKKTKQTFKSAPTKHTKLRHRQNSITSSSSSSNSSSSESESCSSSSDYSNSSSSESRSSRSSSSSGSSSRSSSTSSTKSKLRSSKRSQHVHSKLKKSKYKDHLRNKEKERKDEDAIIISDESDEDVKIKVEKMTEGFNSTSKSIDASALNSVNVLVDEKNDGFVCEAQNAPKDINIITRPEYIIITKKSLGNLKVTETEDGKLQVAPEKLKDIKDSSKIFDKFNKTGVESHKEEETLSLSNKRLSTNKEDGSSIDRNLEEVNKDCSIQDYCNINTSLQDVLSAKKLNEVKAKMKKRQNKLKMHEKPKESLKDIKISSDLSLENLSGTEDDEDSNENPFCKLSVSSISNNRLSDDSHLLLEDSNSNISGNIVAKKKVKRRSHSKSVDGASRRKYRRRGSEDLKQIETLRQERLNTWISHVNDHLSPDHLRQSKSRKRKKGHKEKSQHLSTHKKVELKHKSSHDDRYRRKKKKRKHD